MVAPGRTEGARAIAAEPRGREDARS